MLPPDAGVTCVPSGALHERALVLAHPDQDHDMGQVLQALALILEIQRDLAREQKRIIARLGHQ
jgi:hypothetical protein